MNNILLYGCRIGKRLWRQADAFLAPPLCPLCRQEPAGGSTGICPACEEELPKLSEQRCPLCGGGRGGLLEICRHCAAEESSQLWFHGVSALPFKGLAREAIHRFKYQKQTCLAPFLAARMAEAWRQYGGPARPQLIVPVPLHWSRLWRRGFNQSALLACFIGRTLQLPVRNALRRKRMTSQQAGLSREERGKNLKNAFQIRHRVTVARQSILLIDDVFTTGNTLNEATRALLHNGAAEVNILTIARD